MSWQSFNNRRNFGSSTLFGAPLAPGVKYLLIILVLGFIIKAVVKINPFLIFMSPPLVLQGQVWQFFTSTFFFFSPVSLIFSCLVVYSLGSTLERMWGTKHFILYYLFGGMATHILTFLFFLLVRIIEPDNFVILAADGNSVPFGTLMGAFCTIFWNTEVNFNFFPARGKTILFIWAGIFTLGFLFDHAIWMNSLSGLVVGYFYIQGIQFRYFKKLKGNIKEKFRLWGLKRKYRNFRVVDSEVQRMCDELENRINKKG